MKKHFLPLIVMALLTSAVYAAPIDPTRAISVAEQFMPMQQVNPKHSKATPAKQQTSDIVYIHFMPKSGKPAIYVVNIGNGFALVSADDVAHPVLGYNYGKAWPTNVDSLAPSIKGFLDDIASQIEAASEHPQNAETAAEWHQPRRSPHRAKENNNLPDSVGPLLTTTWDQGQYYNALCPEDGQSRYDGHVPTGCGATAMAQIIKYWGDREQLHTRGIHSYESPYNTLTVNFNTTSYDFANMPNTLTSENSLQEVNAVAKLMCECGVAVNMKYGPTESSSYSIDYRAALINFYGFSPDICLDVRGHHPDSIWEKMLREEINQGRPVLYTGDRGGGGHAFVCDGYKNDGFYHFNYGWNGNSDGWYRVSPAETDYVPYSFSQQALLGIVPDSAGDVILGTTTGVNTYQLTRPIRFYHIMGHNHSLGASVGIDCMSENNFICDYNRTLAVDKVYYENQPMSINDKNSGQLGLFDPAIDKILYQGNGHNTFHTPTNKILIGYYGDDSNYGFCFYVRTDLDCPAPANIMLKREAASIRVMWTLEEDKSVSWELEYGVHGFQRGKGSFIKTDTIGAILTNVTKGEIYDIYIRSVCDETHHSYWEKFQLYFDPYWTDVVTEQPDGYLEDANGNIYISSAEGLSWLASKVNGLNGEKPHTFIDTTVYLLADIDLGAYRWNAIGRYFPSKTYRFERCYFNGTFEGNNHVISNLNIVDTTGNLGLFGHMFMEERYQQTRKTIIRNVRLERGSVSCPWSVRGEQFGATSEGIGALVGFGMNVEIDNCHSSVSVHGQANIGSLCGEIYCSGTMLTCHVQNCSATGNVQGISGCGGLIGQVYGNVEVRNCYATGKVLLEKAGLRPWYRGGLIGNFMCNATVSNCYSTGQVEVPSYDSQYNGKVIGCPYVDPHIHYLYGLDSINPGMELIGNLCEDISDTTHFHHNGLSNTLHAPIIIDAVSCTSLLDALNAWVAHTNNSNLFTWKIDPLTGFPVFGKQYEPSCYNPTAVIASNATLPGDTVIRTKLTWTQKGKPVQWEVLYVVSGQDLSTGTKQIVNSNPCVLTDIPIGNPLDFYVRAICAKNDTSGWSELISYIPDKLRWTEVVTSQPKGYKEDNKNIYISSAEALAWLSRILNINPETVESGGCLGGGKNIHLMNDVDMSAYRWTPLGWKGCISSCNFMGHNHTISGLYCNEQIGNVGLFGYLIYGSISNVRIHGGNVSGKENTGLLIGYSSSVRISSCMVDGKVKGNINSGGIAGRMETGWCDEEYCDNIIYNSCFIGSVSGEQKGGLCGDPILARIENSYIVYNNRILFVGDRGIDVFIKNCYYKNFNKKPNYKNAENYTTLNISAFDKQEDSWVLTTPPEIDGITYSDLIEALNAWVDVNNDANNEDGKYRHWVADTENINEGYPILDTNEHIEEAVESVVSKEPTATKILIDNVIYILRGDKIYTVTGQEVK